MELKITLRLLFYCVNDKYFVYESIGPDWKVCTLSAEVAHLAVVLARSIDPIDLIVLL